MITFAQLKERAWEYAAKAEERYTALSPLGKAAVWVWVALHFVVGGLFWFIGPDRIFAYFAGVADDIRELPYGWAVLGAVIIVTSLPPLIGYGTAQTLVGFAYGVTPGFYISAGSCLLGGAFSFLVVRRLIHLFAPYIHRNSTFQALSQAVRVKGLPLIIMIRLCPFPYPYSNAFFASIESVSLGEFLLATLAITPKLLLHVFIGHRTYLFADPESRKSMDSVSRWLNGVLMVGGSLLGFATSYYLYKLTMRYVAEADGVAQSDLEAGLLDDVDEMLAGQTTPEEDGQARGGRAGRESEERWDEDEDWGEEDELPQQLPKQQSKVQEAAPVQQGAKAGRRDSEAWGFDGAAETGGGRRDSEAWGLDGDDEGGEELIRLEEPQKRDKRLD
ncbi:hypothetical protein JCM10207_002318 [Rhodosporidiobolus poonsookiae]